MNVRISTLLLICLLVIGAGILYFFVDPSVTKWLPRCPFHAITKLDCPACGNQRAIHALIHFDFASAWRFNPFFVLSIPYLIVLFFSSFFNHGYMYEVKRIAQNKHIVNIYLSLVIFWWIYRNTKYINLIYP